MADYSKTLQLRESPVPMRANLPQNEPKAVAEWEKKRLYERLARKRAGAPRFVLHDGPPYANGELHMGHALNKSLKDIIVRYKSLAGYDAPYVPGWDCHGLPIEHNVMKESERSHDKAKKADAAELSSIRKKCRSYAQKYVGIQREGFKRLGCIGKWDDPYLTMDPQFESRIIEAFGELHSRGFIYRGQKPIHWCPHCRTALAASTAEAEYATHVTDAITVAFASTNDPSTSILIWTTTPWTLPANLAVAVRADLEYVTVKTGGRHFIVAESLLEKTAEEAGWSEYTTGDRVSGAQLEGRTFR
ncbi:MAG: class I tRNA ligase family protein, partial [Candidatus Hydrogenedentota bacterium]